MCGSYIMLYNISDHMESEISLTSSPSQIWLYTEKFWLYMEEIFHIWLHTCRIEKKFLPLPTPGDGT
jgi:hypothetical protein